MGYYYDDGVYHKDAYDDDHLDLEDIGKFCEKRFGRNNNPHDMTAEERRQLKEQAIEIIPQQQPERAGSLSAVIALLLGALIGLWVWRFTGRFSLGFAIAMIGISAGRLYNHVIIEEVYLSPKEIVQFLLKQYEMRAALALLFLELVTLLRIKFII